MYWPRYHEDSLMPDMSLELIEESLSANIETFHIPHPIINPLFAAVVCGLSNQ
jgi:hypothetical protein